MRFTKPRLDHHASRELPTEHVFCRPWVAKSQPPRVVSCTGFYAISANEMFHLNIDQDTMSTHMSEHRYSVLSCTN